MSETEKVLKIQTPLTEEEIINLIHNAEFYNLDGIEFVRTIEYAHGIGITNRLI